MAVTANRKSRLGIPKVNPDPRPPNEPKRDGNNNGPGDAAPGVNGPGGPNGRGRGQNNANNGGNGNGGGASGQGQGQNNQGQGQGNGQGGNGQGNGGGNGGGGGNGQAPHLNGLLKKLAKLQTKQKTPVQSATAPNQPLNQQAVTNQIAALNGNPANALAFSSFSPQPGQPDPRDSTYWQNVSNLLFNTQQDIGSANLAQSRETIDYGKAEADAQTNRQRQQKSLAESAMSQGLAHSGWLDNADAQDTYDFLRQREDAQTGYTRDTQDRNAAISNAIQSFIGGERDQTMSAVDRFNQAQMDRATKEAPLYSSADINRLEKLLKRRKKKDQGGGGNGGNGNGGNGGHGHG